MYYVNYMHKRSCMVSYNTYMIWLTKLLKRHWKRYVHMFRMNKITLMSMCYDLETQYGLKPLRMINVIEKVAMFFYIITLSASNKKVQERSQNLGKTICRYSNKVLKKIFCS